MLSPQQIQSIKTQAGAPTPQPVQPGAPATDEQVQQLIKGYGAPTQPTQPEANPSQPVQGGFQASPLASFAKNYGSTIQSAVSNLGQALTPPSTNQPYLQGLKQAGEKVLQGTGAGWQAIFAPISAGVDTAIPKGSLGGGAGEATAKGAAMGAPFGPWGMGIGGALGLIEHLASTTDFMKQNPQVMNDINNALITFAPLLAGGKAGEGATDLANTPVQDYPGALAQSFTGTPGGEVPATADTAPEDRYLPNNIVQSRLNDIVGVKTPEGADTSLYDQFLRQSNPDIADKILNSVGENDKVNSPQDFADKVNSALTPEEQKIAAPDINRTVGDMQHTESMYGDNAYQMYHTDAPGTGIAGAVKGAVEGVGGAISDATEGAKGLYDAITSQSPEQAEEAMTKYFEKGVRPTVSGKGTSGQQEAYQQNALDAVKTIVQNKDNLNILNKFGEVTGKLPTSLDEFSQAIDQAKKLVFDKYDALQKAAGEKGATVDLTPITDELNKVAADPTLQDMNKRAVKYAQNMAQTLETRGEYTTDQAQSAIARLNKSLEAYYKNPDYNNSTKASIDALIANNMRTGLDKVIEDTKNTDDPSYQELKNQYGSLKSIEKDVVHRAIVSGRQNVKGLLDFSDVLSAGEVIKGLTSMNPTDVVTGAAMKGIAKYYKYLNDPNTAIKQLFNVAEKHYGS